MIYQRLLFARTHTVDYRWMIVPTFLNASDLAGVEQVVWSEEVRRSYFETIKRPRTALFPLFLLRNPNAYLLARFRRTTQRDQHGRLIDCIEGIAVPRAYAWHLRFALARLLTDFASLLEVWDTVPWTNADTVVHTPSKDMEFSLAAVEGLDYKFTTADPSAPLDGKRLLRFDRHSYRRLCDWLYPDGLVRTMSLLQFAFGAETQASDRLYAQGFDIVVPITGVYTPMPAGASLNAPPARTAPTEEPPPQLDFNQRVEQLKSAGQGATVATGKRKRASPADKSFLGNVIKKLTSSDDP